MQKKFIGFFLGIAAFLVILLFTDLEPGKPEVTATMAVAALMAIWWVTETIPLAVTALVPMVLFPALGVVDGKTVSEVYINHIIFVYVGGFMMALAMEKWNLHRRIALKLLVFIGVSPGRILVGFMLPTATPPNAIIFGTNRINIATMVRTGFLLNMIGILVVVLVTWLLGKTVLDIVPGVIPEWGLRP